MLNGVCTKATLEEIGNPTVFELTLLHCQQIVGQRE